MEEVIIILKIFGSVLFVLFFFGFCVFIHELGHFLAAKWRGLHIVAFSIGFKKIWGFTYGGVEYRIGCIPFGGYVDIPQIDSTGEPKTEDDRVLPKAKPIDRIITAFAGPFFNVLFGFFLAFFVWKFGIPQFTPKMHKITVADINEKSPEYKAGLRANDVIIKLNGKSFYCTWNQFVQKILFTLGKVRLSVCRGDAIFDVEYKPAVNPNVMPGEKLAYPFFVPKIPVVVYPEPDSPAWKAGLRPGDIVKKVNGEDINNRQDFVRAIDESQGKPLNCVISRDNKTILIANIIPEDAGIPPRYMLGVRYRPEIPLRIIDILKDSAAETAGLRSGDIIQEINGKQLTSPEEFVNAIKNCNGSAIPLTINRDNKIISLAVTPKLHKFFTIGVDFISYNHPTPWHQFVTVINMSLKSLEGIFFGELHRVGLTKKGSSLRPRHFTGPLGIVRIIYRSVYRGSIIQGIYIIVLITFSLAMLNLLPIPVLDGGHILLAIIELIFGKPLPAKLIQPVTFTFMVLLISFMLFVSYYDVMRYVNDIFPAKPELAKQPAPSQNKTPIKAKDDR